jgi:DNA-binding GntR family transcriptional regulator
VTRAANTPRSPAEPGPSEPKRSAADRAYAALRRQILDNHLPAGESFLEEELALRLGLSRTPVREAIVRLQDDGLVALRPRRGMRVLPVSADDMREIYAVLTELEAAAARTAAERGLTSAQLAAMTAAVNAMDKALEADDLVAWAAADETFHRLLVEASGNRRLAAIVAQFSDQAHRARMLTLRLRSKPVASNADHRAVVAAIRANDPITAEEVHRSHRRKAGIALVELLERMRLPNV